ncbi:hypothetical protein WMF31_19930 [Sorangium sp. So ce1036]|uniref:hypothetical protein n=1 Tax=Sorangium sp. So ce1036 TaxID=3133328 RepID=UPI003F10D403
MQLGHDADSVQQPHASVAVVESSLDQLIPVEYRADLVLELRDERDALVLAIVLEVQRDVDPDKKYSWPAAVAHGNGPSGLTVVQAALAALGRLD